MADRLIKIPSPARMGRSLIEHDERSKGFRASAILPTSASLRERTWRRGFAYDQGHTSQCVAYTGKGMLNTFPHSKKVDYDLRSQYSPPAFYQGAQRHDQWEGESPDYEGTSGLGLCKYLKSQNLITEYRWHFSLEEVLLSLSNYGPVGLGTWWWTDMFYPKFRGKITPTGDRVGGHEVELIGIDPSVKEVIGMNSWGKSWGDNGRFRLNFEDLEYLLADQGDAFILVN